MRTFNINESVLKKYGFILYLILLILTGCEKEGSSSDKEKLFFGTVWKKDKVDYYLDGTLVKSIEYNADNPVFIHFYEDLSLGYYLDNGKYYRYIINYSISNLHITIHPNIPERVVTTVNQTAMVIETNGYQRDISSEIIEYDHAVYYYSAAKTGPLASSFEGEWHNYKQELYRDGQIVKSWDQDMRVKYSKDGHVTYLTPNPLLEDEYYLLVGDKLVFSKSNELSIVHTVSINGDEMVQESSETILGITKSYFRKVK